MPIFEQASGTLLSVKPPRAAVVFSEYRAGTCEAGHSAKIHLDDFPKPLAGKVAQRSHDNGQPGSCELEFADAIPESTTIGEKVDALIENRKLPNVVFFARPAASSANSTAQLFVIEPGSSSARRATVRYGEMSGPFIQIIDGLTPGDQVIVTDMSKWTKYKHIRLQ
ncbi:MAG: hypothetical protein JO061_15580 [Acidobacteriaceae bacterium]|nr:hypothetical protein [Acidobacteriaceae bacterium]